MSRHLEPRDVPAAIAERGTAAFLISVGDTRPHVVSVAVSVGATADAADHAVRLQVGAGRRSPRNVEARPAVTLLWPADASHPDLALVVDGVATVDADGTTISIEVTGAVLHTTNPSGPDRTC